MRLLVIRFCLLFDQCYRFESVLTLPVKVLQLTLDSKMH